MTRSKAPRARLVATLRAPTPEMRKALAELKTKALARAASPTFVWDSLIQSFATMGNSRGWQGLIENMNNAKRVKYGVVRRIQDHQRFAHFDGVLRDAVVRMPAQKARWLVANFARLERMGGTSAAKKAAIAAPGREAKLAFMTQFDGIGPKYARNIWMDVYHPDFYDAVAIDERIKKVTVALGLSFSRYADHERFYQELAREAALQPWELDRLLYHFSAYVLDRISR